MKKLETTKKISENVLLRVYKKGYGYSRLNVFEVNDHYIAAFADSKLLKSINAGDRIEVYFWVDNVASYDFTLRVLGKIEMNKNIIFLDHTEGIKRSETRRCLSAEVDLPIKFFLFDTGEKNKSFSMETVELHRGRVIRLGDRTATIEYKGDLSDNVFYKGHININGEDLELLGKFNPTKEKHVYEITFSGMHDKERSILLDYVFSVYRE